MTTCQQKAIQVICENHQGEQMQCSLADFNHYHFAEGWRILGRPAELPLDVPTDQPRLF